VRVCCVVTVFGSLTNNLVRNPVCARERERERECVRKRVCVCAVWLPSSVA